MSLADSAKLRLLIPDAWTNAQKGEFFEQFVASLLRPMSYEVVNRLRFTGMEIDLLARHRHRPDQVLVECKAHENNLNADVITKLMGNRQLRKADCAWLFTTGDLTKDGRGAWEEIQSDPNLSREFTWYSPQRIIQLLLDQGAVKSQDFISGVLSSSTIGELTLLITPDRTYWIAQLIQGGLPTEYTAFDAKTGDGISSGNSAPFADAFPALHYRELAKAAAPAASAAPATVGKTTIAKVTSGDSWDDPRPSRPSDFIGREDLLTEIFDFLQLVRRGTTSTRVFTLEGPSGWGKSSLAVKLGHLAKSGRTIDDCSIVAVDTRSATDLLFVCEAVRASLEDARARGYIGTSNELNITSQTSPLDSPDVKAAFADVISRNALIVLVFDQFEELFAKEELFETFHLIKLLSFAVDAAQVPFLLGFAWKTDISLPQQHPAYYLWHELSDRRKPFLIRKLSNGDIQKLIGKAERQFGTKLTQAIKSRLIEQSQGLPWLAKKLTVHILTQLPTVESQHELLERELDVEVLFKDDLSRLSDPQQTECLKYVASNSPAAVATVETLFPAAVTTGLMQLRLLVRSGMNYTVYWDIFRDYLVDGKVPSIPWARTFQREIAPAMKMFAVLANSGPSTLQGISTAVQASEASCQNVLSDLFALQLVNSLEGSRYSIAEHIKFQEPKEVARFVAKQLRRHSIYLALLERIRPGGQMTVDEWVRFFREHHGGKSTYSTVTIRQYAMRLRLWLIYAGLLEQHGAVLVRPIGEGSAIATVSQVVAGVGGFLACANPLSLLNVVKKISSGQASFAQLMAGGFRNSLRDGIVLGIFRRSGPNMELLMNAANPQRVEQSVRERARSQNTIRLAIEHRNASNDVLAAQVMKSLGRTWKPSSQVRYVNALRVWADWVDGGRSHGRNWRPPSTNDDDLFRRHD